MTTETLAKSQLLPVSILAGPSARQILQDVVSRDANCRFGLLTGSPVCFQTVGDQLMVEPLVAASAGGYDPLRIKAQISAVAEKALINHLIIECDSKTHPIALASLFLPDGSDGQPFSEVARLSSIGLAIDSETLLSSIVNGNHAPGVTSPCILADQIECADVIVLNGEPADQEFRLARAVVSALNPSGRVISRSREETTPKLFDATRSFDFEAVFAGAGWRKLMEGEPDVRHSDEGVTMFVYRARQPFHPEKFWNLIQTPFPGVFRAKGFFWLATRMSLVGGLNIAGLECHYSPAGQWWAAHDRDDDSGPAEVPERLKKEWAEPFGDRRQAIAFMGIGMNSGELSARLDACLLSASEMKSGEHSWAMLPDPFPSWSARAHDHDCDDHDCCHH
jgi:G3E family GTPase